MKEYKVITKSLWSLNCKEATFLTELSKEGKLSFPLKVRLWYHLTICVSCKQFQKQTQLLAEKMKTLGGEKNTPHTAMDASDKQHLQEAIERELAKKNTD